MPASFKKATRIAPPGAISALFPHNTYYEYQTSLSLPKAERNASLLIAAHTDYAFYLDETLIAFGQFADYAESPVYDIVSLPLIEAGEHDIRIEVYHTGVSTSRVRNRDTYLLFEVQSEQNAVLAASSTGTKVRLHPHYRSGPIENVSGQLGFTVAYDETAPQTEWLEAISAGPAPLPRPRPIEKLTVSENRPVTLLKKGTFKAGSGSIGQRAYLSTLDPEGESDGTFLRYDLGRESTGVLSLDLTVNEDTELLISWGEHLDDSRVRGYVGGRNFTLSYKAKAGKNRFVCPFLRLGLRYFEVYAFTPAIDISYIGIKETLYPLQERPAFRCDSPLHNRIYDISLRTLHLCMHEHYEDCPWREQALYSMDSRNQMLCGYYAFGETRFARASLELMGASLRPDHLLELCSPAEVFITIPSFSAIYLTQLAEYLDHSGDLDFVSRMLPVALDIADAFVKRAENPFGILPAYPAKEHWNFYEWSDGMSGQIGGVIPDDQIRYDAPLCAFVSIALRDLARILRVLGRNEEAARYESARLALNEAINRHFWDESAGAYATFARDPHLTRSHFAELTNALILYADAVPQERVDALCARLAADDPTLIPVTLSHSIFKYEVLLRHGTYHTYVFDKIAKVFTAMLEKDATTFWETEKGGDDFGNAGSLCHGWSAIPVYLYHKYALHPTEETGLGKCFTAPRHTFSE